MITQKYFSYITKLTKISFSCWSLKFPNLTSEINLPTLLTLRSRGSHQGRSVKKGVLKIFLQNSQENTCARVSFPFYRTSLGDSFWRSDHFWKYVVSVNDDVSPSLHWFMTSLWITTAFRIYLKDINFEKSSLSFFVSLLNTHICGAKPTPLLKLTLLHRCFSRFLNCTNGTKSRNLPHKNYVRKLTQSYEHFQKGWITYLIWNIGNIIWCICNTKKFKVGRLTSSSLKINMTKNLNDDKCKQKKKNK